jgi:hypothetical protein
MGLAFHSESAMLRGIKRRALQTTLDRTNGAIFCARSDNDTGNNPHNPVYGIHAAGADGGLIALAGSESSDSGGNSTIPMTMFDPTARPTKVASPGEARGLVDTGQLVTLLQNPADAAAVMAASEAISGSKVAKLSETALVKALINCSYQETTELVGQFGDPNALDPTQDAALTSIITPAEFAQSELRKTASMMKLVLGGFAGAGTVELGGYDYHDGTRATGERKDEIAGQAIGAALEYAARVGRPLVIYILSDGSLASDGVVDNSVDGAGQARVARRQLGHVVDRDARIRSGRPARHDGGREPGRALPSVGLCRDRRVADRRQRDGARGGGRAQLPRAARRGGPVLDRAAGRTTRRERVGARPAHRVRGAAALRRLGGRLGESADAQRREAERRPARASRIAPPSDSAAETTRPGPVYHGRLHRGRTVNAGILLIFQNYLGRTSDAEMVRDQIHLAELAEPLGFDSLWPPEHHFTDYSACPDNVQFLSYMAAKTSGIQLGTGAVIVPWNDPLRVVGEDRVPRPPLERPRDPGSRPRASRASSTSTSGSR